MFELRPLRVGDLEALNWCELCSWNDQCVQSNETGGLIDLKLKCVPQWDSQCIEPRGLRVMNETSRLIVMEPAPGAWSF